MTTTYNTFRNPLLEDNVTKPIKVNMSIKSFFNQTNFKLSNVFYHKKIVPTASKESRKKKSEPLVYYNGPHDTLDQLPEEKLSWITKETSEYDELQHPLLGYQKSIVLRKPYHRNQPSLGFMYQHDTSNKIRPKATFYIRVLQVINQNSSKSCLVRASVEVNGEVFTGSYTTSQKCGKNGTQANIDETYILDVEKESIVNLKIYSQPKTTFGAINSRFRQPEVCLGTQEFVVPMRPLDKKLKRVMIHNSETDEKYQVLVIFGTYVSSRVMTLLDNKIIYTGFITVYTRGKLIPRWARYWAILYPGHIELYDFEYKDKRKALYKISIKALLDVFHPPTDDDERLVDVGSLGLALQFSSESLLEDKAIHPDFEYRMYILPDDHERSNEWEQALLQAASLINEFRYDKNYTAAKVINNEDDADLQTMVISSKFLW